MDDPPVRDAREMEADVVRDVAAGTRALKVALMLLESMQRTATDEQGADEETTAGP